MAKNFSDNYLKNLKPKTQRFKAREAKEFAFEVLPTGIKTFLYIYEQDGKRKQVQVRNIPDE